MNCDQVDLDSEAIVDYQQSFSDSLLAQGKGGNVLILSKLDQPFQRFDGKKAIYQLDYRWLSVDCEHESDQAWACVQGSEYTYWQRKEIEGLLKNIAKDKDANLFDRFNLF
jgi:hypothetical protein